MSIECGECERDLRGGHADDCSRRLKCKPGHTYSHRWKYEASDWDNLPAGTGCATCLDCGKQEFTSRCLDQRAVKCTGRTVGGESCCAECFYEEY